MLKTLKERFLARVKKVTPEKGPEYFVTCRRCGGKYERDIPRRPQDESSFLCDNCQSEFDDLVVHGRKPEREARKWHPVRSIDQEEGLIGAAGRQRSKYFSKEALTTWARRQRLEHFTRSLLRDLEGFSIPSSWLNPPIDKTLRWLAILEEKGMTPRGERDMVGIIADYGPVARMTFSEIEERAVYPRLEWVLITWGYEQKSPDELAEAAGVSTEEIVYLLQEYGLGREQAYWMVLNKKQIADALKRQG